MFKVLEAEDGKLIVLSGDIVAGQINELRDVLYEISSQQKRLVLDFSKVTLLDSTSAGLLISTQKKIQKAGGRMLIFEMPKSIIHTLKMMRLDHTFTFISAHEEIF